MFTRLPSNPRLTTSKCVHLVTRGHFQSCEKDGAYYIQSTIAENPMLHTNLTALCFIELESKFYIAERRIFYLFVPVTSTWPDNLHIWTRPIFPEDIPDVQKWTSQIKALENYRITACECTHVVTCGHFQNPKKVIFNIIIHTYFRLFVISEKNKLLPLIHHTWKMSPHYLAKCKTFTSDCR